jgi:hypothetical protein
MNPIIEAMARAMQAHEWSSSAGAPPLFEGDERKYWIDCAQATYAAIIASGHWIAPNEATPAMIDAAGDFHANGMWSAADDSIYNGIYRAMKQAAQQEG